MEKLLTEKEKSIKKMKPYPFGCCIAPIGMKCLYRALTKKEIETHMMRHKNSINTKRNKSRQYECLIEKIEGTDFVSQTRSQIARHHTPELAPGIDEEASEEDYLDVEYLLEVNISDESHSKNPKYNGEVMGTMNLNENVNMFPSECESTESINNDIDAFSLKEHDLEHDYASIGIQHSNESIFDEEMPREMPDARPDVTNQQIDIYLTSPVQELTESIENIDDVELLQGQSHGDALGDATVDLAVDEAGNERNSSQYVSIGDTPDGFSMQFRDDASEEANDQLIFESRTNLNAIFPSATPP